MNDFPPSDLLGRLAVHYGFISMEQLSIATRAQTQTPDRLLGEVLKALGYIDDLKLAQLLEAQRQYLEAMTVTQAAAAAAPAPAPPPEAAAPPPPPPPPPVTSSRPSKFPKKKTALQPNPTRVDPKRAIGHAKWLDKVLVRAVAKNASDVHFRARATVKARIYQRLVNLSEDVISDSQAEQVLLAVMTEEQRATYFEDGEVDFSYAVRDIARFRVNVYNQHGGACGVFHHIGAKPPLLADLGLPNNAARLTNHQNGIVLITGPSGAGKTSTMAALTNIINEERADHILTIEDPIEYIHTSKRCIVNQRQISRDTKSFAAALKSALREDPDVICIGELRDLETISLALSAAETGHLVLGTLHTQGAVRTINRIIGAYPSGQQPQVRTMLSESLRAIISQKLIPRADGRGIALAYELMFVTQAASNMIRENRTFQMTSVLQTGRAAGMCSLDDSLRELLQRGEIDKEHAMLNADNPNMFR